MEQIPQQPQDDEKIPGAKSEERLEAEAKAEDPEAMKHTFGQTEGEKQVMENAKQEAIALAKEAAEKKILDPEKIRGSIARASDMGELFGLLAGLEKEVGGSATIETSAGPITLHNTIKRLQEIWEKDRFKGMLKNAPSEEIEGYLMASGITSTGDLRGTIVKTIMANRADPKEKPSALKRLSGWFK